MQDIIFYCANAPTVYVCQTNTSYCAVFNVLRSVLFCFLLIALSDVYDVLIFYVRAQVVYVGQ